MGAVSKAGSAPLISAERRISSDGHYIAVPFPSIPIPGNTHHFTKFLSPKYILLDKKYSPCSNLWLGALRPWHGIRQPECGRLITNQTDMKYPLTTGYPLKRRIPVSGDNYPVTSDSPHPKTSISPPQACGPLPCEPQNGPPLDAPNTNPTLSNAPYPDRRSTYPRTARTAAHHAFYSVKTTL